MAPDGSSPPLDGVEPLARGERLNLLAFAADRETEAVLREAVQPMFAAGVQVRRGEVAQAARALQRMPTPSVLIVDVGNERDPVLALEELSAFVEPGARVLVVGDRTDLAFYREITRGLGALEYLAKPLNRDAIARFFAPAITGGGPLDMGVRGGRVIAVAGVRGGVGTTMVAVNLAVHLAEASRHHVALIDADLHAGTAALKLSAPPGEGLRQALENPGRVDEVFLERAVHIVNDRLQILSSEEKLGIAPAIAPGAPRQILDLLRRRHNYIVVDVARAQSPLAQEFLDCAHHLVLVLDPTLPSVRDTLRRLAVPKGPAQAGRPILVVNHVGAPGMLPVKELARALDCEPEVMIPHLPKPMRMAATLGDPLVRRNAVLKRAMERLAFEVAGARESKGGAPEPTAIVKPGGLKRLFGKGAS